MIEDITRWDFYLLEKINPLFSAEFWVYPMGLFSGIGEAGIVWILFATYLCFRKKEYKTSGAIILSLLFSVVIINLGMKPFFARLRPFIQDSSIQLLIPPPGEYSFPSGHSASSFAAAIAYWQMARAKDSSLKWMVLLLAGCIAFSRLYFMVHFPSDVLVGGVVGALCGWISAKIVMGYSERRK